MCLIVFAWQAHPRYRLVVAANRDEFHDRPAQPADWWPDRPDMLAGRDLAAGGTWLAVGRSGRFAAVTNYREDRPVGAAAQSRGDLVADFVSGTAPPLAFAESLRGSRFAGFSLLLATGDELACVSNRGGAPRLLPPGIYGLSNAALDTPWPKLVRSRERLHRLMQDDRVDDAALLDLLNDRTAATAGEASGDALPFALPKIVGSPFIVSRDYGTRCSTALLQTPAGTLTFIEKRFDREGAASGQSRFSFELTGTRRRD